MTRFALLMLLGCALFLPVCSAQDQAATPAPDARALSENQEQVPPAITATQCKQWDDTFRQTYHYWLLGVLVLSFLVPLLISALPRKHWLFTVPWRRALAVAAVLLALSAVACVVFPWFSLRGWVQPGIGLLAYGGGPGDYLQCGPQISFEAPRFLGFFGLPDRAAITQLMVMFVLLVAACALGAAASLALQHYYLARRYGLQAAAREVKA